MPASAPLLEPKKPPRHLTAADVRLAMTRRYVNPEWALLFEVINATGAAHTRSADALAMSLWPSRGLDLHGFEIKVARSDWLKEKATPAKAEPIASYCDYWWLVSTPGVVQARDEIPRTWGWIECDGDHLTELKQPARLEAKVMDRKFLAALLRRAARTDDAMMEAELKRRDEARTANFEATVKAAVDRRLRDSDGALKDIEAFEQASGIKISEFRGFSSDAAKVGRAVKAIVASGVDATWGGAFSLAKSLREQAEKIETAMAENGFEKPGDPTVTTTAHRKRAPR